VKERLFYLQSSLAYATRMIMSLTQVSHLIEPKIMSRACIALTWRGFTSAGTLAARSSTSRTLSCQVTIDGRAFTSHQTVPVIRSGKRAYAILGVNRLSVRSALSGKQIASSRLTSYRDQRHGTRER